MTSALPAPGTCDWRPRGSRREARGRRAEQLGTMNTFEIQGDWNIARRKLKRRWAQLTEDDWCVVARKQDELLGPLQKRTQATRRAVGPAHPTWSDGWL